MDTLRLVVLRGCGLEAHVSPLGATLVRVLAPGRGGARDDVTLGYGCASDYAAGRTYFGAAVGRLANRVAGASFDPGDGGPRAVLAANDGPHALHGGPSGFHARWWTVDALLGPDGEPHAGGGGAEAEPAGVRLSLASPDGDEGYPGALAATVTYMLRPDDGSGLGAAADPPSPSAPRHPALLTRFSATVTGRPTPVGLVQHAYWNLGGHSSGPILGTHTLWLPTATAYTPVAGDLIPTGEVTPVAGTPFDFVSAGGGGGAGGAPWLLGARAAAVPGGRGYDHNLCLLGGPHGARAAAQAPAGPPALAAVLAHAGGSGRSLRLWTDAPGLQLYTGGFLAGEPGKDGAAYCQYGGVCLETQGWPDAVNRPGTAFPSPTLRPGQQYTHTMVTQFCVDE